MFALFTDVTSLPNLHPALVHFPIALLASAFAVDLCSLILRRQLWLEKSATLLYVMGALGGGAAYLAGRQAEDGLANVPAEVQPLIARHADGAFWVLVIFIAVAAVRTALAWQDRAGSKPFTRPVRVATFLAAAGGVVLLVQTADRGGALVYRHALAVGRRTPARSASAAPPAVIGAAPAATTTVHRGDDGSIHWEPRSSEVGALGTLLSPAPGSPATGVSAVASALDAAGLSLAVTRPGLLVLPGVFADVQVEADLDIAAFQGTVGLAHHARELETAGLFTVSRDGKVTLVTRTQAGQTVLDEARIELPAGPLKLAVSSAGTHLKGSIAGTTVVHGHGAAGASASVGLFLDGTGIVRVLKIVVTPLAGH